MEPDSLSTEGSPEKALGHGAAGSELTHARAQIRRLGLASAASDRPRAVRFPAAHAACGMRHAAQGDRWTSKPSGLRIIFRFGIRPLAGEVRDVDVNVDVDMDAGYGRCGTLRPSAWM